VASILVSVSLLLLILTPDHASWWVYRLLGHLGIALFIAGLIAFALETEHFIDYFEARLSSILTKREFINLLGESTLRGVQESITVKLLGYELDEDMRRLYAKSNEFLLEVFSTNYRRNYVVDITISQSETNPEMLLVKSCSSYELVSPSRERLTEYPVSLNTTALRHPTFPGPYMKSCKIFADDKELDVQKEEKTKGSYVEWGAKAAVNFKGSTNIRIEREQYIWKEDSPVFTLRTTHLTRNVTMFVRMATKARYLVEARTFGFFESKTVGTGENGISVYFMDWMLPKNGIIVTWQERPKDASQLGLDTSNQLRQDV